MNEDQKTTDWKARLAEAPGEYAFIRNRDLLALLGRLRDAEARCIAMAGALRAAENHILTESEARDYDPPAPPMLIADIAHALAEPTQ